ncbi:MAG: SUMF1/EgtB/PvdO family nonheme iron enzyme [Phycisphaerales bacterium]
MTRVPGGEVENAAGEIVQVGDLWVLTTEAPWELYDVYLYALDEPEGGGGDAITRPSKPYVPPDRGFGHTGYPAIGMTRHAAESFCAWLEAKSGIPVRLPTPEEWTRAAQSVALEGAAWCANNSDGTTHPVGKMPANVHGLRDMLGNAAEWVATDSGRPAAMGGSYRDACDACTPTAMQRQTPAWNTSDPQIPKSVWWLADCSWVGFRFVVEVEKMPENVGRSGEEAADDE